MTNPPAGFGIDDSPSNGIDDQADIAGVLRLTDAEFAQISALVHERLGIFLGEQKRSLVAGRLQKLVRARNYPSFSAYLSDVIADTTGAELVELANRITTNHTFFFREGAHFDFLRSTVLPFWAEKLKKSGSRDLRIWSAGCATGEEPYTLAITLMEFFGLEYESWNAGVLATDVSTKALETAKLGIYPEERLLEVPEALRQRYFTRLADGNWQVKERVRKEVTFRRLNFNGGDFLFKKPFHAIFCRNVMIYFDQAFRDSLVSRFYTCTEKEGYFFIGHAESLGRERTQYSYIRPAVYRKER